MKHIDLFSGIGGFSLAASWAGFETILFCDNNRFCQELLKRRFNGEVITDTTKLRPQNEKDKQELEGTRSGKLDVEQSRSIPIYGDIRDLDGTKYRGATLLTGGFPCQPFSCAGKRKGKEDDRYLWDEMFRVIREAEPKWVLAENVYGLLTIDNGMVFNKVLSDLESIGYEVQPLIIPACAVNAPHRRDRVWIVAKNTVNNGNGNREPEGREDIGGGDKEITADTKNINGKWKQSSRNRKRQSERQIRNHNSTSSNTTGIRRQEVHDQSQSQQSNGVCSYTHNWEKDWVAVALTTCFRGMDDGLPAVLDGLKLSKSRHREERLKALGNAIVPQVAYKIIKVIADYEVNNVE